MKTVSATEFVRQARKIFDQVLSEREAVSVERNGRAVVQVVPAAREMTAKEALGDIFGMLDRQAGKRWNKDSRTPAKEGVSDPWAS